MRKPKPKKTFSNIDQLTSDYVEPKTWTIITALDRVVGLARDSELSQIFWKEAAHPLQFLSKTLGLSQMQVVIIAILVEHGETMNWRNMCDYLECSRISMMCYTDEIEDLVEKGWICNRITRGVGEREGFALVKGVTEALRHNKSFVPENLSGLTIQQLMEKLERFSDKAQNDHYIEFEEAEKWMVRLCKANPQLPLSRAVMSFDYDLHVQSLLLLIVIDYAQWADSEYVGLTMGTIDKNYPDEYDTDSIRQNLIDGTHILILKGLIEQKCVDGVADPERYTLTRHTLEELLDGYNPSNSKCVTHGPSTDDLKSYKLIQEKAMYYNAAEGQQVARLTQLLSEDRLADIQKRLAEEGMRTGVAVLLYGLPGTGKTETVKQIARATGRDIMQIDISELRNKYVGETEKNIKAIFKRYNNICKHADGPIPLLFFNEADAIFGKRTSISGSNPAVEKMENSMQNIILEELENLNGILIATTNLSCNLDSAFERRFLFKIEFLNPGKEVKVKLWKSMLGDLTDEEAQVLASRYAFSGGQIENIARKRTIDYILNGVKPSFVEIDNYCQSEILNTGKERKHIGFAC